MTEDCRHVVFEAVKDRLPVGYSFEAFTANLHKYEFLPLTVEGACVGAVMCSGCEVHAAVLPQARGRWFTKRVARWLRALLQLHGKLTTKVLINHAPGHAFAARLGFTQVRCDANLVHYEVLA